jgi:hypothetical protein
MFVAIFLGVILPFIALLVEYQCRFCTGAFFNPIPTWWHVAMVAWVGIGNGWILAYLANEGYKPSGREGLIIGSVIGISLIYAVRFLPIMPMGFVMTLYFGLGSLAFAPLFSMFVGIHLARKVWYMDPKAKVKVPNPGIGKFVITGIALGVACVYGVELPHVITRQALKRAISPDPVIARSGINTLRNFGNQFELLKLCYSDKPQMSDMTLMISGQWDMIDTAAARNVFYRVTGIPFNREKFPKGDLGISDDSWIWGWERRWDDEVGGEAVGGRVDKLSLQSSDLDVDCDPNSASANMDWTFVFENQSDGQAEARTKIALPPGAVVSDLVLWINGVPQPAAFGAKGTVRAAYQKVVARKRDPVLVTSAGGDRVMLQCFPVPAHGTMKTKVSIAVPLLIEKDKATLVLPKLVENNFDIFKPMKTSVKSTSAIKAKPNSLIPSVVANGFAVRGVIDQGKFDTAAEPIVFERNPSAQAVSKLFTLGKTSNVLSQKIIETREAPVQNVVIVMDGSTAMRPFAKDISEAIGSISNRLPWSVVIAADEVSALTPEDAVYQKLTPKVVATKMTDMRFQGGPDNAAALFEAAKIAAQKPDTKILWIHGPQPVSYEDPYAKFSTLQGFHPFVYSFEVESGPNLVAEKLLPFASFRTVPRFGTVREDLTKIVGQLDNGGTVYLPVRSVSPSSNQPENKNDSKHGELIKLWAAGEVFQKLHNGDQMNATKIATTYRIVTPVSGAVVLETKEQFKEAGLKQGEDPTRAQKGAQGEPVFQEEAEVPSVPEPEMWLMIFVVGMLLLIQNKRVQRLLPWRN